MVEYPLSKHAKEQIRTKTGKTLDDINITNILNGNITSEDIKISKETLQKQGDIAKKAGREQLQQNFMRAGELTAVEDELILEIYEMLRPYRSTKEELLAMAERLEKEYQAFHCGALLRETAEVYEKRKIVANR
ncbi:MAG: dehydratase [Epulopiscium sp.]|nr:dehydratase [Candidatus Epulonipiscium sp.]